MLPPCPFLLGGADDYYLMNIDYSMGTFEVQAAYSHHGEKVHTHLNLDIEYASRSDADSCPPGCFHLVK